MVMENCSKKRLMGSSGNDVDRLSSLPEPIRVHILSFLPARDAARTVLIRAFGDLWTEIDTLDFSDIPFTDQDKRSRNCIRKFTRFVSAFFMIHKRPKVHKFRVSSVELIGDLTDYWEMEKVEKKVNLWLKFAFSRGVEVLELNSAPLWTVYGTAVEEIELSYPHFVWTSDSVAELSMRHGEIELPRHVQMRSLRILRLDRVKMTNEMLSKIASGCPLLRHVAVTNCCSRQTVVSFAAPNIEQLTLRFTPDPEEDKHWKLTVNCPNVKFFYFMGCVDFVKLNLPSVKSVNCTLTFPCSVENDNFCFMKFLDTIRHSDVLVLDRETFALFTHSVLQNHPFSANKWKRVVLSTSLDRALASGVCGLLQNSGDLEELIIHVEDQLDHLDNKGSTFSIWRKLSDPENTDTVVWNSSQNGIRNLKNVTVHGLFRSSFEVQVDLVKCILEKALALDKLLIFSKSGVHVEENALSCQEIREISNKVLSFPKGSESASVLVL